MVEEETGCLAIALIVGIYVVGRAIYVISTEEEENEVPDDPTPKAIQEAPEAAPQINIPAATRRVEELAMGNLNHRIQSVARSSARSEVVKYFKEVRASVKAPYDAEQYASGMRVAGVSWVLVMAAATAICFGTSKLLAKEAARLPERSPKQSVYDTSHFITAILTIVLAVGSVVTAGYWLPSIIAPESTAVYQTWKNK